MIKVVIMASGIGGGCMHMTLVITESCNMAAIHQLIW